MPRAGKSPPSPFLTVNVGHILTIFTIIVAAAMSYGKFTAEFDSLRMQVGLYKEQLEKTIIRVDKIDSEGSKALAPTVALIMAHERRITDADFVIRNVGVLENRIQHLEEKEKERQAKN